MISNFPFVVDEGSKEHYRNFFKSGFYKGKSLEIVTKIVESSAYLNKDISSCPTISKSFRNKLKRYGPLILP